MNITRFTGGAVIAGDPDHPANFGKLLRRLRIDPKGTIGFRFAKIDIGKCGGVDQNIEIKAANRFGDFPVVLQIEHLVIEANEIEWIAECAHERRSEPALALGWHSVSPISRQPRLIPGAGGS